MTLKEFHTLRKKVHVSALDKYTKGGSIFIDYRRSRPRWFDGRFLKAADLNREISYFLTRQADLAVSGGTGVVEGLLVSENGATRLKISRGYGMTFDGERVFLPKDVDINIHNIPLAQQINAELGLSKKPLPSLRSLSGIYIVALRALSFTANPTASYPVDVAGERRLKDGDVIEATAITLVPYEYPMGPSLFAQSSDQSLMAHQRRAQIAHSIFTEVAENKLPASTLPLAMLDLRRGAVHWVDNNMVRRDMGAVFSDDLGFGFVPRHLRRAHFKQYDEMIDEILAERPHARFAAAEYFVSLPSAGRMPSASVDMSTLTQYYFPESMDVEISVIPEDELATLVEESLLLPPIPLTGEEDELAAHSVMVFLPVPRQVFYGLTKKLKKAPAPVGFKVKAVRSMFKPRDYIGVFRAKLPDFSVAPPKSEAGLAEVNWNTLIARERFLWFVRRRNLNYKDEVSGTAVNVMTNEFQDETDMRKFQRTLKLYDDFTHLKVKGSAAADLEMVRLLTIPKFTAKRTPADNAPQVLMRAALKEFGQAKKLDEKHAATVSLRFADRRMGKGIAKVENQIITGSAAKKAEKAAKLAEALCVPELDFVAATLSKAELTPFAAKLGTLLSDPAKKPKDVATFVFSKKEELES
jgi:hypothetical protein